MMCEAGFLELMVFFIFCRMANNYEVLKRNVSLKGRELELLREYRKDPHPEAPSKFESEAPLEQFSEEELKTQAKERYSGTFLIQYSSHMSTMPG